MDDEGTVFITEGEKDADTLAKLDDIPTTTIPNGAGFSQWIDLYNDGLQGKDIIILTDNDDAGRKYGNTVAVNVVSIAKSVKIIPATAIWDKCPEKGDISDIVQALGADEATRLLADAIHRMPFFTPESLPKLLKETEQFANAPIQPKIEYTFVRLSDVKPKKQEFLWNPYIPIGEITVMYAAGGTGKSYATIGIAADITTGRSLPRYGIEQMVINPEKVLFISAEDNESIILSRMTEAGGNPDNCFVLKTPKTKKDLDTDSFLLPQNKNDTERIQAFSRLLEQIRPKLVIIDPWSVYIGDDKNMNKANDVRAITNVLTVLAKEYNCAILVVAHVNKMPQIENANNAVSGSTALIDSARSALCIRSFGADSDRRVIIQTKSNYQKKAKSVCYQIINQGENRTARFEWDGFSDLTEDDLTNAARTGKKLTDIASEKEEDAENTAVIVDVIIKLAKPNEKIPISYNRLRSEIIENCGVDFLGGQPKKEMYKALSDLRTRGIGLEFPVGTVRGFAKDGKREERNRGFYICCLTDGHLMAEAMPK
jgi:5S rRNA maturation endonuclease (ribonuclease M5)